MADEVLLRHTPPSSPTLHCLIPCPPTADLQRSTTVPLTPTKSPLAFTINLLPTPTPFNLQYTFPLLSPQTPVPTTTPRCCTRNAPWSLVIGDRAPCRAVPCDHTRTIKSLSKAHTALLLLRHGIKSQETRPFLSAASKQSPRCPFVLTLVPEDIYSNCVIPFQHQ